MSLVNSIAEKRGTPNWLLCAFVGVSLVIHLFIFIHIGNLYGSNMLTYIELTLKDISKPPKRSIPRPRHITKTPELSQDVKRLKVSPRPIPEFKQIRMAPVEVDLPESLVERISMPDTPNVPGLNTYTWNPEDLITTDYQAITSSSYLDMVRLKIESHKIYPNIARIMQLEGRVTISFTILLAGNTKSVKVVKSSKFKILDQAALNAVKNASPFPKPPVHLFKGEIPLKISLLFELT